MLWFKRLQKRGKNPLGLEAAFSRIIKASLPLIVHLRIHSLVHSNQASEECDEDDDGFHEIILYVFVLFIVVGDEQFNHMLR